MNEIKLVTDTINDKDIDELIEWLKTYPRLTKGNKTLELEKKFASWIGTEYSLFINSGSSANLLMVAALIEAGKLKRGDKVFIPALSWSTDLSPLIHLGLEPILVDCNFDDLSIDVEHLRLLLRLHKDDLPKVLILVSVLGLVPNMDNIIELCNKQGIIILEDNCESLGSKFNGTKLGNFGIMSSYSTYFGHHISTIEGGFVTTTDEQLYDILLGLRSHGWDRDLSKSKQQRLRQTWNVTNFQSLYTFYFPGFNLRSTDLNAFIGLGQLKKLDKIVETRNKLWNEYIINLHPELWHPEFDTKKYVSAFAFPIIVNNEELRNLLVNKLQEGKVEVRPIICGSMGTQPVFVQRYGEMKLTNVTEVDKTGWT